MKYKIITVLIFSFITQKINSQTFVYNIPKEVDYISKLDTVGYVKNLYASFLPIGWSTSGKFAYALEPPDEACGCYFFELHIFDVITNKDWFTWQYSDENKGVKSGTSTIDTVWAQMKIFFYKKLIQAGIGQQKKIELMKDLFTNNVDFISITKKIETIDYGEMVKEYTIIKKEKNKKYINKLGDIIYYKKYASWEKERKIWTSYVIDVNTVGYIKSPFTNHHILLHNVMHRGWEGSPHVFHIEVSGFTGLIKSKKLLNNQK